MPPDTKEETSDLLWDCFVNWAGILERIEEEKKRRPESPGAFEVASRFETTSG